MGLFDLFKKKIAEFSTETNEEDTALPTETNEEIIPEAITNFRCFYLYGFTNDPFRHSHDQIAFGNLYEKIIGDTGGFIIVGSFHPYQVVNQKGTTVWQAAYLHPYIVGKNEEAFDAIINHNGRILVDPSADFKNVSVWPDDTRLTYEENPEFSRYVPFIIPFLLYKADQPLNWDIQINREIKAFGHASEFLESVTNATRFLMPEPSFIVGFDEFEESNLSGLIDRFMACKYMFQAVVPGQ